MILVGSAIGLALCATPNVTRAQKPDTTRAAADSSADFQSLEPGKGFQVAKTDYGDLWISAYTLFRFIDQMPGAQSYADHLGRTREIDTRQDLQWHRVMMFLKGWLYDPKFRYTAAAWTVGATQQVALIGNLRYRFSDHFDIAVGINGLPGTRTLRGSHPFWLGHDRVMSDEFIRPGFT